VHVPAGRQEGRDGHARSVALQHAVGDEHQPVTHLEWQRRRPVTNRLSPACSVSASFAAKLRTERDIDRALFAKWLEQARAIELGE
jgi:hypothetical protein